MGRIAVLKENLALSKDRKIIIEKFKLLEAFDSSSAVTLEQLGISEDLSRQNKSKVGSLYSHFLYIKGSKIILDYDNKYYLDQSALKRQDLALLIMKLFMFIILPFIIFYLSYLNW